jgi:uncharacterized membrane protein YgcG
MLLQTGVVVDVTGNEPDYTAALEQAHSVLQRLLTQKKSEQQQQQHHQQQQQQQQQQEVPPSVDLVQLFESWWFGGGEVQETASKTLASPVDMQSDTVVTAGQQQIQDTQPAVSTAGPASQFISPGNSSSSVSALQCRPVPFVPWASSADPRGSYGSCNCPISALQHNCSLTQLAGTMQTTATEVARLERAYAIGTLRRSSSSSSSSSSMASLETPPRVTVAGCLPIESSYSSSSSSSSRPSNDAGNGGVVVSIGGNTGSKQVAPAALLYSSVTSAGLLLRDWLYDEMA